MENSRPLSPKQRRLRNREEMITAITQTARDVMREQGVAALNLNEIARRLGMQTPSLYEYFPNKMALYDHLFRLGTRLFREMLAEAEAQPDPTAWAHLERIFTVYLQGAIDYPELFMMVYERHVPGFVPSEESMKEAIDALEAGNQYLQNFLNAAKIDLPLTLEQVRDTLIALMHGITALHLANNPDQPVGEGRFGSLIPLVIDMLKKAWGKEDE